MADACSTCDGGGGAAGIACGAPRSTAAWSSVVRPAAGGDVSPPPFWTAPGGFGTCSNSCSHARSAAPHSWRGASSGSWRALSEPCSVCVLPVPAPPTQMSVPFTPRSAPRTSGSTAVAYAAA